MLHPDLEIDLEKALKKLEGIIADNDGTIASQENQGKKKLAYQIKKQDFAVYIFNEVEIAPKSANKVQSLLNITDEVVRYLMVEKDLKPPVNETKPRDEEKSAEADTKEG